MQQAALHCTDALDFQLHHQLSDVSDARHHQWLFHSKETVTGTTELCSAMLHANHIMALSQLGT